MAALQQYLWHSVISKKRRKKEERKTRHSSEAHSFDDYHCNKQQQHSPLGRSFAAVPSSEPLPPQLLSGKREDRSNCSVTVLMHRMEWRVLF